MHISDKTNEQSVREVTTSIVSLSTHAQILECSVTAEHVECTHYMEALQNK